MTDLNINYEGKPCYKICFRPNFDDFISVFNSEVNKHYDYVCVVTDSNVADLYLPVFLNIVNNICNNVSSFCFQAGEESKNLETVNALYQYLISKKFTRNSLLIALGGGVVGDLTGFTASTFLRGIDFIQIPTTLLSQVDSSVGGKTGVDFNGYKNMVGAFYMPKLVYMNLATLTSLDSANFACGMGEVIKSALISDKDFYYWLKSNSDKLVAKEYDALLYAVSKCCKIKGDIVEIDPKENGIRSYLNFGHTIGHAIEKLCNFSLGHGQCVSLGMICAAYLSQKLEYISENDFNDIKHTIHSFNLPTSIANLDGSEILDASKSDKKMKGSKIKFIVLEEIGEANSYLDFSDEDLLDAIDRVLE